MATGPVKFQQAMQDRLTTLGIEMATFGAEIGRAQDRLATATNLDDAAAALRGED